MTALAFASSSGLLSASGNSLFLVPALLAGVKMFECNGSGPCYARTMLLASLLALASNILITYSNVQEGTIDASRAALIAVTLSCILLNLNGFAALAVPGPKSVKWSAAILMGCVTITLVGFRLNSTRYADTRAYYECFAIAGACLTATFGAIARNEVHPLHVLSPLLSVLLLTWHTDSDFKWLLFAIIAIFSARFVVGKQVRMQLMAILFAALAYIPVVVWRNSEESAWYLPAVLVFVGLLLFVVKGPTSASRAMIVGVMALGVLLSAVAGLVDRGSFDEYVVRVLSIFLISCLALSLWPTGDGQGHWETIGLPAVASLLLFARNRSSGGVGTPEDVAKMLKWSREDVATILTCLVAYALTPSWPLRLLVAAPYVIAHLSSVPLPGLSQQEQCSLSFYDYTTDTEHKIQGQQGQGIAGTRVIWKFGIQNNDVVKSEKDVANFIESALGTLKDTAPEAVTTVLDDDDDANNKYIVTAIFLFDAETQELAQKILDELGNFDAPYYVRKLLEKDDPKTYRGVAARGCSAVLYEGNNYTGLQTLVPAHGSAELTKAECRLDIQRSTGDFMCGDVVVKKDAYSGGDQETCDGKAELVPCYPQTLKEDQTARSILFPRAYAPIVKPFVVTGVQPSATDVMWKVLIYGSVVMTPLMLNLRYTQLAAFFFAIVIIGLPVIGHRAGLHTFLGLGSERVTSDVFSANEFGVLIGMLMLAALAVSYSAAAFVRDRNVARGMGMLVVSVAIALLTASYPLTTTLPLFFAVLMFTLMMLFVSKGAVVPSLMTLMCSSFALLHARNVGGEQWIPHMWSTMIRDLSGQEPTRRLEFTEACTHSYCIDPSGTPVAMDATEEVLAMKNAEQQQALVDATAQAAQDVAQLNQQQATASEEQVTQEQANEEQAREIYAMNAQRCRQHKESYVRALHIVTNTPSSATPAEKLCVLSHQDGDCASRCKDHWSEEPEKPLSESLDDTRNRLSALDDSFMRESDEEFIRRHVSALQSRLEQD